jgi:Ca2+-binding EF-hand superfamily protein
MGCGPSSAAGGVATAPARDADQPVAANDEEQAAQDLGGNLPGAGRGGAAKCAVPGALPNSRTGKAVNWAEIRAKLPWDLTDAQKKQRQDIFRRMDVNGSAQLSLAEVDKGLRDVLDIEEIFYSKPVIIRAFNQVKGLDASKGVAANGLNHADFVGFSEFRLMLQYLYHFLVLYEFFCSTDRDGEGRLSVEEFKSAKPQLEQLGIHIDNYDVEFTKVVKTVGARNILFSEFAEWALQKNLHNAIHKE